MILRVRSRALAQEDVSQAGACQGRAANLNGTFLTLGEKGEV
jgi:hypothetical protein